MKKKATAKGAGKAGSGPKNGRSEDVYKLRLYVAGQTPKSLAALTNLKRICSEYLDERYEIEVIDLLKDPARAHNDQVVAIPTLVRKLPEPLRRIIGDLSDMQRVLVGLDIAKLQEHFSARAAKA